MHGVSKESSSTTKLRIVFDASAKSSSGVSLNDTLIPGPSLYPKLTTILNRFRRHNIGLSADVSKMFREVVLDPAERDYHRFLMSDPNSQEVKTYRMKRLTFGVTSSPFLASKVLQQVAEDHQASYPGVAQIVKEDFYVDDVLTGASTESQAMQIRSELCDLLQEAGMTLRKWRSSSAEVYASIPEHLRESEGLSISTERHLESKALGVYCDVGNDNFFVSVPHLDFKQSPTKREIASSAAKVFDILGWFSPSIVLVKILLQRIWEMGTGWDEPVSDALAKSWNQWRQELPQILSKGIPRKLYDRGKEVLEIQLHGFTDASSAAYGGVVYVRARYADTSVSISLLTAKTKVAPLKKATIPRLELCAAVLTARLLEAAARDLNIESHNLYAWTDSTIVLSWLHSSPSRLKVYVAHRVQDIVNIIPPSQWRHVPSTQNPADHASRGVLPEELLSIRLWWDGPPWLVQTADQWPHQPKPEPGSQLPEVRNVMTITTSSIHFDLWDRYSDLNRLLRITAWMQCFISGCQQGQNYHTNKLTPKELQDALLKLTHLSQMEYFTSEFIQLSQGKAIAPSNPLFSLQPMIGSDGLLRVGGRLQHSSATAKHPIILHKASRCTFLLIRRLHMENSHAGPSVLMALLAEMYYVSSAKRLTRRVTRECVICRRAYAKTLHQQMGRLPADRVNPSPPFNITGVDLAGPFLCSRGNPRKPTKIKTYACLFVCMVTRAIHLELLSDLSSSAFIAGFTRFCARRGLPSTVYSDNGTNFVGANKEFKDVYRKIIEDGTLDHIVQNSIHPVEWKFSPTGAPHFGGLWEAGVRSMKQLLKKSVGTLPLSYEELHTVLAVVESILNSRPLTSPDSLPVNGEHLLTPGHFLIGRPLRSPPNRTSGTSRIPFFKRWKLVNQLSQDLWLKWYGAYLQSLQARHKWESASRNLQVGDVVLLKDQSLATPHWPLAAVQRVFPGEDGLVRVVEIRCKGKLYRRPVTKLALLVAEDQGRSTRPPLDVQASDA